MTILLTRLFPLWAIVLSAIAFSFPSLFSGFKSAIIPLLSIVMFGMGMTLDLQQFRQVARRPAIIALCAGIQFVFMPLFAWLIAKLLSLSVAQTTGMILVGSSAGGTASNVICYLARGNVALSVSMTLTTTMLAVLAMPLLTLLYIGQSVQVPFWKMTVSILQIVLIPVLLGTAINSAWSNHVDRVRAIFPLISTLAIVFIIAIIVAVNQANIAGTGLLIVLAVVLHNLAGLGTGYVVPRALGYDSVTCRTVSIEVGMQNSGLSVALATKYFSAAAALPGAIFSIWHNISGSVLASFWNRQRQE